ncbi:hypothetical protein KJZ99_00095 [bacterium]|nr:hypothetical protein [bacterium]
MRIVATLPETTYAILFPYQNSTSEETDIANADAELLTRFLGLNATWQAFNGGVRETEATGGITDVVVGDGTKYPTGTGYTSLATDTVIVMAAAWEGSASVRKFLPIVEYNGEPVPWDDISHLGDGYTASDRVIILDNTNGDYPHTDDANYRVTFIPMPLPLAGMSPGAVDLPVSEVSSKILSVSGTILKRKTNDGESSSVTLTALRNIGRIRVANGATGAAAEIVNDPGDDFMRAIYGSNWTPGGKNRKGYLASDRSLCLCVVELNNEYPEFTASAAAAGQVWAKLTLHYGGSITSHDSLANMEGDSTDNIEQPVQFQFTSVWERSLLTLSS